MSDVYEQFESHFNGMSVYLICEVNSKTDRIESLAKIVTKRMGSGRVYCYFQVFGYEMVRVHVDGYGYDKIGASIEKAAKSLLKNEQIKGILENPNSENYNYLGFNLLKLLPKFGRNFSEWDNILRDAGFTLIQVV